eukprot:4430774-Ditylum_brightwellii.AAC.1
MSLSSLVDDQLASFTIVESSSIMVSFEVAMSLFSSIDDKLGLIVFIITASLVACLGVDFVQRSRSCMDSGGDGIPFPKGVSGWVIVFVSVEDPGCVCTGVNSDNELNDDDSSKTVFMLDMSMLSECCKSK